MIKFKTFREFKNVYFSDDHFRTQLNIKFN